MASDSSSPGNLTDNEFWRDKLSSAEFYVLRQAGTEPPFTGLLLDEKRAGRYVCKACGNYLFAADTKFESGCGWPSFYQAVESAAVIERDDDSLGMRRTEVLCATCHSHLGHVFPDGYGTPTGNRYCINSICLTFEPAE